MGYVLKCKEIFLENEIKKNSCILIEDGLIKEIQDDIKCKSSIDLRDYTLIPGLIDIHSHGAMGFDTMDASYEAINEVSKYLAKNGVTSFLPTTITAPMDKIENAVENVADVMKKGVEGAEILGTYLEGPYLTEEHNGAHPIELMRELSIDELKNILKVSKNTIKVVTMAPEKKGAKESIEFLRRQSVRVSIGHTNATYEETMDAIEAGASIGVHTFNGMRGIHHREPGVVGAIMKHQDVVGELIADTIHVNPVIMEILYKVKGLDGICLISDCMRAGGLSDGKYMLGELEVTVRNGIARTDSGSLAGSTLKLINGVKNIMNATSIQFNKALQMATRTPAKALGMYDDIGSIKVGKKANLVALDKNYNVKMTIVNGKIIFKNID
ncbi:N-acetylglucosamine-6-phosphate deacetylase [Clostridium botulinum]|uniref:N-acetylglucosamine-6-phosphate deacetylase n=1 Tax=Clostridium botulinum C/D str. DC5 TaxID=1443128 RepID=A0A0A0ID93_CLOBO|nr:N-acetylglucosamine-6-phosphate deacetylase [Clostridium botulinum]KEI05922.1 N-acetylglucosamine-6-phosphate deacetylase [Clostridium botulinum C/D str. BKT75002]KEI12330.1 N-acetylglucosamine-6-phosphate deacetylase [Clostridium botulinum C/D str. BKT2873]KGM95365.1 N-acetylglucosamine-6-phosphate deacetylase [Clostridium botulinum D str. CCUG 7971]KGM97570.1 N-acetylglucosamine-6-phosphate deacetylase [Clostridium botulinum C/D str. DC5]KOC54393.1 N-acetylglucosamine-6-phosphate deacetyl